MHSIDYLKRFNNQIYYNHSSISSFKSGGRIKYLIYPNDYFAALNTIIYLQTNNVPFLCVGNCTNILIKDEGYKGIMLCLNRLKGMSLEKDGIYASAGESLFNIAYAAKENSLSGVESLAYIPGTIGGAIAMNAGAMQKEIKDVVEYADIIIDGNIEKVDNNWFNFGYRYSVLQQNNAVVMGVKLKLKTENRLVIDSVMKEGLSYRRRTQPQGVSLGCVFKSIDGVSAGYYIDKAGLKGVRINGAQISKKHANFIINTGGAKSSDFVKLSNLVKSKVDNLFNVSLQYEVLLV